MPVNERLITTVPRVQVLFYRAVTASGKKIDKLIGTDSVLSMNTSKKLYSPEGSFRLLMRRQTDDLRWADVLQPNDKVVLVVQTGDVRETLMVGLIDSVRESESISGNAMRRTCEISGTDYAKIFRMFRVNTSWMYAAGGITSKDRLLHELDIPFRRTNGKQLDALLDWMKQYLTRLKFGSQTDTIVRRITADSEIVEAGWINYQGDLWGMMQLVTSPPFTELFIDTLNSRPTLIFRDTPFDDLRVLNMRTVQRNEWMSRNLGKSDMEVKNVFQVFPKLPTSGLTVFTHFPSYSAESIDRFGIRELRLNTNLVPYRAWSSAKMLGCNPDKKDWEADKTQSTNILQLLQEKLKRWFGLMENMLSGSVVLRGRPDIRIGEALTFEDRPETFYVSEVHHEFVVKEHFQTRLALIRGAVARAA